MRPRDRAGHGGGLLLLAVLLVGINLRGAIAAVSPVLPGIRAELGLSPPVAGLLTTLPVLCFAAAAPAAAWFGRRIGPERAIVLGLLVIAAGTVLRVLDGAPVLFAVTVVIGAAMTLGNVLLPVVVKRNFAARAGTVTGLYTAALAGGAAATAALTAPLAVVWGWRTGLAAWAAVALLAAVVWQMAHGRRFRTTELVDVPGPPGAPERARLWRHPVAWAVTMVLGLQSVAYYSVTAWLPTLLVEDVGLDLEAAGLAASVFQILGIPGTLIVPALVGRRPAQGWLGVAVAAGWTATVGGLLVWPSAWLLWSAVGGIAQGAGISLAFTLLVLRAHDEGVVRRLSSMSQLVGYTIGAAGPLAVGAIYQATGDWTAPLAVLVAVCVAMGAAASVAGRPTSIGAPHPPLFDPLDDAEAPCPHS